MKRILIFTNHFLPGNRAGGPVTSIANLVTLLSDNYKLIIVTSNIDLGVDEPYNEVIYDKVVRYKDFNVMYLSEINVASVQSAIQELTPDLIYLNSFFSTFTQLVLFSTVTKKVKTPIILAPRGELQENALAIKTLKKKVYLTLYKLLKLYKKVHFHATDAIEYERVHKMFHVDKITTLPNVPKISNTKARSKEKNSLKLIFISRIRDNKNLLFALEALANTKHTITFDIYGPIEDEKYWSRCQDKIQILPQNITTAYKGVVSPAAISNTMQQYHVLFLPTKTENFGHVIVEAMQSGLIPIISDQTPWVNLEENSAGYSLNLNNIESFTDAINALYEIDEKEYTQLSASTILFITKKLNIEELKQRYVKMFDTQIYKT